MKNSRRAAVVLAAAAAVAVAAAVLFFAVRRDSRADSSGDLSADASPSASSSTDISSSAQPGNSSGADSSEPDFSEYAGYEPPPLDVDADRSDTFTGEADLTGVWENRYSLSETIEFFDDGTFERGALTGTYRVENGCVYMETSSGSETYLRLVQDENGELIWLQRDFKSLPEQYRRSEGKEADVLLTPGGEEISEIDLRMILSAVWQALHNQPWTPATDGISRIKITDDAFILTSDSGVATEWPARLVSAETADNGYLVSILLNGMPYTMTLTFKGPSGSEGGTAVIRSEDEELFTMECWQGLDMGEPEV